VRPAPARIESFPVPVAAPQALVFDRANIWVTSPFDYHVCKVRASDGAVVGSFVAGKCAGAVLDGVNIWVTNYAADSVTKFRASDGAILGRFLVGNSPGAILFDGTTIWVANAFSGTVMRLRASDGNLLATYPVGRNPRAMVFDESGHLWVTDGGNDTVTKFTHDGHSQGTFDTGNAVRHHLCQRQYMITNDYDNTVTKLRASDGALEGTFEVGERPYKSLPAAPTFGCQIMSVTQ
jgi:hypothetical protein